jgi:hypothetical protein
MSELNIDILCANSPQAKGRVERAHQTLQDRLVKELRLRGISSMEAGNDFLPSFQEDYNARFARPPANAHDAHRSLRPEHALDEIFRWKEQRKLTINLTLHYRRKLYLVDETDAARAAAGKMVDVHEHEDGSVTIRHGRAVLAAYELRKDGHVSQQDIESNKYLGRALSLIRDRQLARDAAALRSSKKKTIREKDRLEADLVRRAVGDERPDVDPDLDADLLRRALANVRIAAAAAAAKH